MSKYSQENHEARKKELLRKCFEVLAAQGLENTGTVSYTHLRAHET